MKQLNTELRQEIARILYEQCFEVNHALLRQHVSEEIGTALRAYGKPVRDYDFVVVCNYHNNSLDVINARQLVVELVPANSIGKENQKCWRITLKPETASAVTVEFALADFTEDRD